MTSLRRLFQPLTLPTLPSSTTPPPAPQDTWRGHLSAALGWLHSPADLRVNHGVPSSPQDYLASLPPGVSTCHGATPGLTWKSEAGWRGSKGLRSTGTRPVPGTRERRGAAGAPPPGVPQAASRCPRRWAVCTPVCSYESMTTCHLFPYSDKTSRFETKFQFPFHVCHASWRFMFPSCSEHRGSAQFKNGNETWLLHLHLLLASNHGNVIRTVHHEFSQWIHAARRCFQPAYL